MMNHSSIGALTRIMANKNAPVLLGGDFSCGDVEWSTMQVPEGVPQRHVQCQLLEFIKGNCLSQEVLRYPSVTKELLIFYLQIPHARSVE